MDDRCEHTGLHKAECGHCRGLSAPSERIPHGSPFTARFDGRCLGECDGRIEPGEQVVQIADWGYKHAEC